LQEGRTRFYPVTVGITSFDGLTQIKTGLTVGEEVVVHSQRVLTSDLRVKVVDALTKAAP